jgi:ubiquinone/menaquinone biosynthesis C-methylase UbiE
MADAVYTHGHHESVLRSHRWRTAANSAAYLLDRLRPGQSLLDVGSGPGTITADLAALVAPGRVTAVDAAPEVLDEARQVLAERSAGNVDLAVADVHALPYPDGSFDVVHAHQVLQHLTDPVRALRELRRVCRPGGVVAARDSDYAAMTWYPEVPALEEWRALYHRLARANGGEPDAGRRLLAWARQAGFDEITSSASAWCYATPEARAWWAGVWSERITRSAIARQALAGGHATEQDLRRLAGGWHAWADAADGWFAVLHGEILCTA